MANIQFNRLYKKEQQVLIQQKYQPESGILINEQFTLQLGEQCHERFTKIKNKILAFANTIIDMEEEEMIRLELIEKQQEMISSLKRSLLVRHETVEKMCKRIRIAEDDTAKGEMIVKPVFNLLFKFLERYKDRKNTEYLLSIKMNMFDVSEIRVRS